MMLSKLVGAASPIGIHSDIFWLFDPSDFFLGRKLLINISHSILSVLPGKRDSAEYVLAQCLLTNSEMRMVLPLLDSPTCCEQAVLYASLCCSYELLLLSFPSTEGRNLVWDECVQAKRDRLARAEAQKSQRTEMRGVYNALFTLRKALEPLGLTIRTSRDGYYLAPFGEI